MRVLLVHKLYSVTGGAEVFVHETARILQDNGHEVFFLCTGEKADEPENALFLKAPRYDNISLPEKIRNLPASIYDLSKKRPVTELIAQFRPDVLHAFGLHVHLTPSVLAAGHESEVPIVMTCNDYRHICPNYKLYHHNRVCFDCKGEKFYHAVKNHCCKDSLGLSIASAMEAYVHKYVDVYGRYVDVFGFSADFMANVTQEFWPNRRISWGKLRNPFDSSSYVATDEYANYGVYFGRLIEEKGVDRLLQAAGDVGGFPIKIVGTGPDATMLQAMAAERGLSNVEFLGPKWGADLDEILKRARFVVVPSLWHENYPYVINQAFAYARPVIGSRRGGIPEMVEHGVRGLVYEADDVAALSAAIRMLAGDEAAAARMGAAAKVYSDTLFRDDVFYVDLMSLYAKARKARASDRYTSVI